MKGKMTRRIMAVGLAAVMAASMSTTAFAKTFDDYKSGWAFEAIDYVSEQGYMSGVGNNNFSAKTAVTRAQMAQVMWNMEGKQEPKSTSHFVDVAKSQWYSKAVNWCSENGIVSGVGDSKYNPNGAVSREQLMTMIYRYLDNKGIDVESQTASAAEMKKKFPGYGTDADKVSGWADKYVRWAYGSGFSSGSGTKMNATQTVTREQLAQFLMNLDLKMLGKDPDIKPDEPSVEQCEHGNDPDTCLICHPEEPQYPGSYRETYDFDDTTMAAVDEDFWGYGPTSDDLASWKENSTPQILEFDDNAFATGLYDDPKYDKVIPIVPEGHVYRNFVPAGGWVENGSTYTVDIGGHTYTKATDGSTIYNRFGVDVTSVDGVMSDKERNMLHVMSETAEELFATGKFAGVYYDPVLQMAAEAILEEAKENSDNLARAGLGDLAAAGTIGQRVTTTRKILELSKKYDFANNADLKKQARELNDLVDGDMDRLHRLYPNGLSLEDLKDFYSEADSDTYNHSGHYYHGATTSDSLRNGPLYEYFGDQQIGEQYDSIVNNGTFFDFEAVTIRTPSDRDYYSTVALVCQDSLSMIGSKFNTVNTCPLKIGIAYDEELHQWAILVCETGGQGAGRTGRYHDCFDVNDNMGWYSSFITSEATEW